jgi:hypothetical protein
MGGSVSRAACFDFAKALPKIGTYEGIVKKQLGVVLVKRYCKF